MIKVVAGIILVAWGYLDAVKYVLEGNKIKDNKSSKGHSRKFINIALGCDIYRLYYFFFIDRNYYVLATAFLALISMSYMWAQLYLWYPYKHRGLCNFKRPSLFIYTINSILPNRLRRRL